MSTLRPEDLFAEPPDPDLLREPKHRLAAQLPDPDSAASVLGELANAGFPTDEIFVVSGDEGIRRIDPAGLHHGLVGRVVRAVDFLAYGELIAEAEEHLEAGGVIMSLPAAIRTSVNTPRRAFVETALRGCAIGGDWTWEEIL